MDVNKTLIFAATYNEAENAEEFCRAVLSLDPTFHLLIVDDNSPDGTGRILDEIAASESRLHVVHRPTKLGLGTAHELAMLYAIREGYSCLVTMDADFSHSPSDIKRLLAELEDADYVTAARYMEGGSCDYTGYRLFVSRAATFLARMLLRIPLHEFTTSFRAFRVELLKTIDFTRVRSRGYSFFLEIVYRVYRRNARMKEVPIFFTDRKAGTSKIPKFEILNGVRRLLYLSAAQFLRPEQSLPDYMPKEERCYLCGSPYLFQASRSYKSRQLLAHNITIFSCLRCALIYGRGDSGEFISPTAASSGSLRMFGPDLKGDVLVVADDNQGFETGIFANVMRISPEQFLDDMHQGSAEQAEKKYNSIIFWESLEFVPDPVAALKAAVTLLAPGGRIWFSTRALERFTSQLLDQRLFWLREPRYFYLYTDAVKQLAGKAGLDIISQSSSLRCITLVQLIAVIAGVFSAKTAERLASRASLSNFRIPADPRGIKVFCCQKSSC